MTIENIFQMDIIEEMEQCFIDYSLSVITDRALPDVRDGLKPVHKRILYAMNDLGLTNNKPHKKSARVVGDVIGKYHPHGDSSVYDAMVRMAQDFSLRYPLVQGQGNFGTIDGDPAAAMRYTEARMSKIAAEMLRDIKKDTVDFRPNFSEDEEEPVVLPSRIPNLLLNGTTGIAVGMACSFPPHHLGSTIDMITSRIKGESTTVEDLVNVIKAPDFPTGGLIINQNELLEGYQTGRGRVRLRGKYTVEKNGKTRENLIFTEIPYAVNKEKLIEDIAKLCETKEIEGIADLRDESNREGIRIVIELKKDVNPDVMANILFSKTQLENTFSINFTCLVDGNPRVLNLMEITDEYIKHQKEVLTRRTQFDLNKVQARLHVLEGYLKALENIDNIIKIIKGSANSSVARKTLEETYGFSEIQSKAILEMKLSKLTGLEKIEIENEISELTSLEEKYLGILNDNSKLMELLLDELAEIKDNYNDERRTDFTQISTNKEEKDIQFVQPEEMVVVMTRNGNIKKIPASSFRVQRKNGKGIKSREDITSCVLRTNTIDSLMIFSNKGVMYRLLVDNIPVGTNSSQGQSIRSLVNMAPDENPETMYSIYRDTDAKYVLFTTKNGLVKKTALEEYINTKKKTGIVAISLREGDSLASVCLIKDEPLTLITNKGYSLTFNSDPHSIKSVYEITSALMNPFSKSV